MAAINDDVYARVREKVKEHNLTEQEVKAVDTAREQLQNHSKVRALLFLFVSIESLTSLFYIL